MKSFKNYTNQINQLSYLTEKRNNNIVVVDIQPMYKIHYNFRSEFANFLTNQRKILYYYNGESVGSDDTPKKIIEYLCEENYYQEPDYNERLYKKLKSKDTIWYDKGYGFFRSWMDEGADESFIIKVIRLLFQRKICTTENIKSEEWELLFPDDWEDYMENDPLTIPDIPLDVLKKFSGSYIVGGGKTECLKEVQLLMNAFNIRYKEVRKFIY